VEVECAKKYLFCADIFFLKIFLYVPPEGRKGVTSQFLPQVNKGYGRFSSRTTKRSALSQVCVVTRKL
jgi:hypothetical protein